MTYSKKVLGLVVLAGLTAGVLVGCPFLPSEKFDLTLENWSGEAMTAMYLRSSNASSWGNDQLAGAGLAGDGDVYTITEIPAGVYDMRAVFTSPAVYRFGVPIVDSNWLWIFTSTQVDSKVVIIDSLVSVPVPEPPAE